MAVYSEDQGAGKPLVGKNTTGFSREELFDLYKVALDEYRFEVQLNWDRTRYYFLFNSAIVGVATGLLRLELSMGLTLLVGLIFLTGLLHSIVGVLAIRRGHQYYRNTVFKKTLIEHLLGYLEPVPGFETNDRAVLAIGTTFGQQATKALLVNDGKPKAKSTRRGNIVSYLTYLLALVGLINLGGCIYVVYRLVNWSSVPPKSTEHSDVYQQMYNLLLFPPSIPGSRN